MKLNAEIVVDASLETTWAAFVHRDNLSRWRNELVSSTTISGEPFMPGSVAELHFNRSGKQSTVIETITERRDENFLAATYETAGLSSLIVSRFEKLSDQSCRWVVWGNFNFRGIRRWTALISAAPVKKTFLADMHRFKLMVESDQASASQ